MDCVSVKKILNDYMDGLLAEEAAWRVEEHLSSCWECEGEFTLLIQVRQELKGAPRHKAPPGFSASVMSLVRAEAAEGVRQAPPEDAPGLLGWLWSMPAYLKIAEAAAIAVFVAAGVYSMGFISGRLTAPAEQADGYQELASLDELDAMPPGSMGEMYLSIKENGYER